MASALEALKEVLKQPAQNEDERGVGGDESVSEALSKEIFAQYVCRRVLLPRHMQLPCHRPCCLLYAVYHIPVFLSRTIDRGVPHPGDIAEAASLSTIQLPSTSYPLFDSLPADVVEQGKLSQLQLEGVLYACSKHQEILPSGQRERFTPSHSAC
jgi:hypothetical protein